VPKNTNVLMIRHGEKPDSGKGLAVAGQERAQAYIIYFQTYSLQPSSNSSPIKLSYLFAAANSSSSDRPKLTIEPLSPAIKVPIDDKHKDTDYKKVADDILQNSKYDKSNILICWHHEQILDLAAALGVDATKSPKGANWPSQWPEDEYGWLLQLCYDANGNIIDSQTVCINEKLMYDDKNDPTGAQS
jgi:hypothetical protein